LTYGELVDAAATLPVPVRESLVLKPLDAMSLIGTSTKRIEGPEKVDGRAEFGIDVRLPGMSGLDFQIELASMDLRLPIVFISGHADVPMSVKAMKRGAIEFLTKPFRDQDLLDAVRLAIERDQVERQRSQMTLDLRTRFDSLTSREKEVFALVSTGLMNKQIAGEMDIREVTVKVHRGNVMRKMGARSLAALVRMADAVKPTTPMAWSASGTTSSSHSTARSSISRSDFDSATSCVS